MQVRLTLTTYLLLCCMLAVRFYVYYISVLTLYFLSLTAADASMVAVSTKTESITGTAAATTTTEGVSAEGSEAEQEDMLGEELGRYLLTEEEQQKRYCTYLTLYTHCIHTHVPMWYCTYCTF